LQRFKSLIKFEEQSVATQAKSPIAIELAAPGVMIEIL
jgi:hypothetical protein